MKKNNYSAPAVDIVEMTIENGIAQSAPTPAPGTTGDVSYNPDQDHHSF